MTSVLNSQTYEGFHLQERDKPFNLIANQGHQVGSLENDFCQAYRRALEFPMDTISVFSFRQWILSQRRAKNSRRGHSWTLESLQQRIPRSEQTGTMDPNGCADLCCNIVWITRLFNGSTFGPASGPPEICQRTHSGNPLPDLMRQRRNSWTLLRSLRLKRADSQRDWFRRQSDSPFPVMSP